jgi:biotin carboxylase
MSAKNTVLIVGGKLKIVQKARALGLGVVYFQHPAQFRPEHRDLVDAAILVDYTDWSVVRPLARAAHEAFGFASVLSLTEPGLGPASRINDMLGLDGNPHIVTHLLADKWAMRQHLVATGTPTVPAARVEGRESLSRFGIDHGYPFVVKPTVGTASIGVFRVDAPAEVDVVWRKLTALQERAADLLCAIDTFVIEAFVDGPEYSVEAFSFAGRHVIVAVTEKMTAENFVEVGHAMPARLSPAVDQAITECAVGFLDAVGLRHGPSHTEIRLGSAGPRVIESHNRVGGGRINELVDAAYGVDLDSLAIGWQFGLVDELPDRPAARCGVATRFLTGGPGKVADIDVPAEVRSHPSLVSLDIGVQPGDEVGSSDGGWERLGQVVTTGADTATAIDNCNDLVGRIAITVERSQD